MQRIEVAGRAGSPRRRDAAPSRQKVSFILKNTMQRTEVAGGAQEPPEDKPRVQTKGKHEASAMTVKIRIAATTISTTDITGTSMTVRIMIIATTMSTTAITDEPSPTSFV